MTLDEYINELIDLRNRGAAQGCDRVVSYRMGGGGIETAHKPLARYTCKKTGKQRNTHLAYSTNKDDWDEPVVVV